MFPRLRTTAKTVQLLLLAALTIAATPLFAQDYTATKSNDTGGAGTVGVTFNWSIAMANISGTGGTWGDGSILFVDSFPGANMTYGTPTVTNVSGVTGTGNISCAFVNTSRLVCRAQGGSVSFSGNSTLSFQIPATPTTAGTFVNPTGGNCAVNPLDDVAESNTSNNNCNADSVTVTTGAAGPDLTVGKTNNRGGTTSNTWTWSILVSNGGSADATFSSGQTILSDNLPNTGVAYGNPILGNQMGISGTGTVSCSIVSFNLTCTASGGTVTLATLGSFTVSTAATPSTSGTFNNPRGGGSCSVDPNNNITEGDETNNSCSDSINVNPGPDFIAVKSNNVGGAATVGSPFIWSIALTNLSSDSGTFFDGGVLFVDSFPNANMTFGTPTVTGVSGVTGTGNISCAFVNTSRLVCRAQGGSVVFSGGGTLTIQVASTPTTAGVFVNPTGGNCAVDGVDDVVELNESNNNCNPDTVTATTGVSGPDLTVGKTNNRGGTTSNTWVWSVQVANGGNMDASFSSGQTILTDNLPNAGVNFGAPTITAQSGISGTGTVSCSIVSFNLSCTASGGTVILAPTGTFTVNTLANPTASGTFVNPRAGGTCAVDPSDNITEGNESNNSCSDSITVNPGPDFIAVKSNSTGGAGFVGMPFNWSIALTNVSADSGTFMDGGVLFVDSLPSTNMSFGAVSVTSISGVTGAGNISCAFVNPSRLVCRAQGGSVVFSAGGTVTIVVPSTPTAQGTFVNPTGGNCAVDGVDDVVELNESNNNCNPDTVVVAVESDLAITKTDGVTTAVPGQTVTYTIVASNNGPSGEPSATVTDAFPAILSCTYTSVAAGGATGNTAAGAGDLAETLNLPSGSSVTYTVTCNIPSSATGGLSNTATISGTITDPVPGNNSATDADTVLEPEADISVTKTDGVTSAVPGQTTLSYTIVAANNGPSDDPAVSLVDMFPADLTCTYTSVAAGGASGNTAAGSGNLAETLNMPAGSSVTYTVNCTIDSSATGTLSNTATATSSVTDTVPGNNSATDNDTVLMPEADIAVTKTDGTTSATPGDTLVYTIAVTNNGPSDDPAVSLTDTLPTELTCTFTSVAAGGATGNTAAGAGNLAETLNMPAGSSVTYTVSCDIDSSATGTLSNTATGTSSVTDPNAGNNSATDGDTVLVPEADIAVTKTDGITSAIPGDMLTYTIVVTNNGPSDDPTVSLTDTLPTELTCTFTSVTAGGATGNTAAAAGDLAETLNMPAGSSVTYTISCDIDSSASGTLSNTATVSGSVTDPDTANNSATDDDTVLMEESDISVTKTDGVTSAVPGQTMLTYTIVVSNAGPSDDPAVSVVDTFPTELTCTYTSVAAGGATGNTPAGSGDIGDTLDMPSGSSVTYTADCDIASSATGTLSNTATATSSVTDPDTANNSATDDDTVLMPEADISVTKTDGITTAIPGLTVVSYTIVITNNGPSDDPAVALDDMLPAELDCSFTSVAAGGATGNTAAGTGDISETLNMPASSSVTYTVDCNIASSATGTLSNTATGTSSVTDPDTGNDSATDDDTVLMPEADLSITKSDGDVLAIIPGAEITYTLTVSNNGPSDSSGGQATDALPGGLNFVSSASGCTAAANVVTCPFGPLVSGDSIDLSFVAVVALTQAMPIVNSATVSGNEPDPNADNDSAIQETPIVIMVPTLNTWGMLVLIGLLGTLAWRRRLTA